MADSQQLSGTALLEQIQAFMADYSIETTTHDEAKFDEIAAELRPGTRVYVAHVPGTPIDDVVSLALTDPRQAPLSKLHSRRHVRQRMTSTRPPGR